MKAKILIFSTITILSLGFIGNTFAGKTPSIAFLQKVAEMMNKNLPQRIDSETMLKATFAQYGAFGYLYILTNYNANEIDSKKFISQRTQPIKNFACTNPRMKRFFNDGVDVIYQYYGKDMKFIAEITVTTKDCR